MTKRLLIALLLLASSAWGATPTSLTLDWTPPAPFTSLVIERCTGPLPCAFAPLVTVPANTISYSESGLTPDGQYSYRTRGNTGEFGTGGTYAADATGSLTLALLNPIVDFYMVERDGAVVASPPAPPYTDTGLTPSTTYTYRVAASASNNGTASPFTLPVMGATLAAVGPPPATNLTITYAPDTPVSRLMGTSTVGPQVDSSNAHHMTAARVAAPVSGQVGSVSVYVGAVSAAPDNLFQVALYADAGGAPDALLAASASRVIVPDTWNTAPLTAGVVAGVTYWLVYNTNGADADANTLRYDIGAPDQYRSRPLPFGTWPATFGTPTWTSPSAVSIYATIGP